MTTAAIAATPSLMMRILFRLPGLGHLLKDLKMGGDSAMLFFAINVILVWVLAGFTFGIAGVLAVAYMLVPTVFFYILGIMIFSGA